MIASEEAADQREGNGIGITDLTPIVDHLYGSLCRFAYRLTKSESDAADLVQQTFFTLVQHLHQVRDFSRVKCWLFTTLRRNFLMEVRYRTKHREVEFEPDIRGLQTVDPGPRSPLDAVTVRGALS